MIEEEYNGLREHLEEVFPIFEKFCYSSGYQLIDSKSLGRYPRIRVENVGFLVRWIDLWMALDEKGDRYKFYFNEIPYELSAGAYYDFDDGTEYGIRYQKSISLFTHRPFNKIPKELYQDLYKGKMEVEGWTRKMLQQHGVKVNLG